MKILLSLISAEGLLAVMLTLVQPSESGSAFLFSLSKPRLILLVFILLLALGCSWFTVEMYRNQRIYCRVKDWVDDKLIHRFWLVPVASTLVLWSVLIFYSYWIILSVNPADYSSYPSWALENFQTLYSFAIRLLPLAGWLGLMSVEAAVFLCIHYSRQLLSLSFWHPTLLVDGLIVNIVIIAISFQWITLIFQLRFFANIPGWYWVISNKPFSARDLLFGGLLLGILIGAGWVLRYSRKSWLPLIVIYLLGLAIQISFGFIEGKGINSLQEKFFFSQHRAYAVSASQINRSIINLVRNYDEIYGQKKFQSTKPPGVMIVYLGIEKLTQLIHPLPTAETRFNQLALVITWVFPFISLLIVFLLYPFARNLLMGHPSGQVAYLAPLYYITAPNVVLIVLFLDQVIYPLVFLSISFWIVYIMYKRSLILAFVTGILLYLAAFFSFTMLLLYPFLCFFLLLDILAHRDRQNVMRHIALFGLIGLGTVFSFFIFRWALNYDFCQHYQKMVTINHNFDFYLRVRLLPPNGSESLSVRLKQILDALFLNNIEFAVSVGLPVFSLFLIHAIRLIFRFVQCKTGPADGIQLSFFFSFCSLNLAGTARGEVARLWLFWVPMVVIFAALESARIMRRRPWIALMILAAQMITVFLIYHFQDLRV